MSAFLDAAARRLQEAFPGAAVQSDPGPYVDRIHLSLPAPKEAVAVTPALTRFLLDHPSWVVAYTDWGLVTAAPPTSGGDDTLTVAHVTLMHAHTR